MRNIHQIFLLTIIVVLAGCSKSPMQKLQSDKVYPDMTATYWVTQLTQKTALWSQAAEYCLDHGDKPNCDSVNKVWMCDGDCNKKSTSTKPWYASQSTDFKANN